MRARDSARAGLILFAICVLPAAAGEASRSEAGFEVSVDATRLGESSMVGGAFVLAAEVAPAAAARGGDYALTAALAPGDFRTPTGSLCFCGAALFADGFESGGTGAWSAAFP